MIKLTENQITRLKEQANIETDRDIYYIYVTDREIIINGDWSIKRDGTPILKNTITAIEKYCTHENINWEYDCAYSALTD